MENAVASSPNEVAFLIHNTWMLIATALVFIMHLGFACLESGLTRSKNTVNVIFKNTAIVAIGLLTYAICGFGLMYPGVEGFSYFAFGGFGVVPPEGAKGLIDYAGGTYTYYTDFLFQAMFAATAATIVSGAVAERIKINAFLIFSTVYVAFVYPIVGSWKWGKGWLEQAGFYDFAGSTLVHSVGGWAALAAVIVLGPRIGKYVKGQVRPIFGHNIPLATIGVFLLWFGWFGFNGGSVLSANPESLSLVFVTTTLAAAAGVIASMITAWVVLRKPDLTMVLNGSLAGLVGITAGADTVTVLSSVIIGAIAGVLVVLAVIGFDKLKIDDPVGALPVHLVCGIWGTLAVGLFSVNEKHSFGTQLLGVAAYGVVCFVSALVIFLLLKFTIGICVDEEEERLGLDLSEHGEVAYPDFQASTHI